MNSVRGLINRRDFDGGWFPVLDLANGVTRARASNQVYWNVRNMAEEVNEAVCAQCIVEYCSE